jgi:hypothetical protein
MHKTRSLDGAIYLPNFDNKTVSVGFAPICVCVKFGRIDSVFAQNPLSLRFSIFSSGGIFMPQNLAAIRPYPVEVLLMATHPCMRQVLF